VDVPTWPSGLIRFDGQTLEWPGPELYRVPVTSRLKFEVKPPEEGRLNLRIEFHAALGSTVTSTWVEQQHEAALTELIAAVHAAAAAAAPQTQE